MRAPGVILVVSCYELGRQPVSVATVVAELERSGFAPRAVDVAVEPLEPAALARARLVLVAVPMHTALRLGTQVAARARAANPRAHVCLYGLYASLNAAHLLAHHADSVAGGESDEPLRALAEALERAPSLAGPVPGISTAAHPAPPTLAKRARAPAVPARRGLPLLERYARLEHEGERRLVAAVEASRGCLHTCRHCPIVPVYGGRFFVVPRETVLADVEQQLAAGAQHVTFGDPDFFNGPGHAIAIVRELHRRWPEVTFDATIKIEHLLKHAALVPALAEAGCLFITSAVESLSDRVLAALDKGHSAADVPRALAIVRAAGIDLRPTLLPYTPWTELEDVRALFDFAEDHALVEEIDPVQYTLRLLIPPGSAILAGEAARPWLGALDPAAFSWSWTHPDPRLDELQRASHALAAQAAHDGATGDETFTRLRALADAAAGLAPRAAAGVPRPRRKVPRITEPWFC